MIAFTGCPASDGASDGAEASASVRSGIGSTETTSSARKTVPKRAAWARIASMSSGPSTPSGKPGKFSTSVVFINCPPGVNAPVNISGRKPARAV